MMLSRICRGTMAFRCPPELLLRNALRFQQTPVRLTTTSGTSGTYKAAVCEDLTKPLQLKQLPRQPLDDGEVRVKLHYTAINFSDLLIIKGQYQEKPPLPFIPGSEACGEVAELGSGVEGLNVGDRVFLAGGMGGFAEEKVDVQENLTKLPPNMSSDEAAATVVSYATAYSALKRTADIQPGETVLVTAAAGAVGLAAVDLAVNIFGANVIGAAGGPDKCKLVKERGAMATIDYNKENIRDRVKELTDGNGANVILDAVGGKVFDQCLRSVSFEGRIVVIGFASGDIPKIPAGVVLVKNCSIRGIYWGSYRYLHPEFFKHSVEETMKMLADKKIKPHISKSFKLDNVNEAFQFIQDRKSTGKVLLQLR